MDKKFWSFIQQSGQVWDGRIKIPIVITQKLLHLVAGVIAQRSDRVSKGQQVFEFGGLEQALAEFQAQLFPTLGHGRYFESFKRFTITGVVTTKDQSQGTFLDPLDFGCVRCTEGGMPQRGSVFTYWSQVGSPHPEQIITGGTETFKLCEHEELPIALGRHEVSVRLPFEILS